jgi:hypothetical protein
MPVFMQQSLRFPNHLPILTADIKQGRRMEINAHSISNIKQAQVQSEVSNKMAKTTLDTMKAEGAQILEMMESLPNLHLLHLRDQ